MPINGKVEPLITTHEPFGCHLQAIGSVAGCWDWNTNTFDALLERDHNQGDGYKGQYFTATIVSIARYLNPGDAQIARQDRDHEELTKRGFVILGYQPGAHSHSSGPYEMVLYGKGFRLPEKEESDAKSKLPENG